DQTGDASSISLTDDGGAGALWIGGSNALLRLEVPALRPASTPPTVTLQSVRTDTAGLAALHAGGPMKFGPGIGRLDFSFAPGAGAPVAFTGRPAGLGRSTLADAPTSSPGGTARPTCQRSHARTFPLQHGQVGIPRKHQPRNPQSPQRRGRARRHAGGERADR